MTHRGIRHGPRVQKRCWCGSGKKEKNCHRQRPTPAARRAFVPAKAVAAATVPAESPTPRALTKTPDVAVSPWGVPGGWPCLNSEKRLWVAHPCGFVFCKGGAFLLSLF